ncbi:MAG: glycerol-3-phosphate responsive antiterminator [Lachnospiraceae bacterium]|nr:glycerol-3-phosphate responsive antiterminator [Lachnospiraceae bacterium]
MKKEVYDAIMDNPVIAGVRTESDLNACIKSGINVVFFLYGDILNIDVLVKKAKEAGKIVFVHVDLIAGFSSKDIVVDFIKEKTLADGIISTKLNLVKRGNEVGLATIYRVFIIDSMATANLEHQVKQIKSDLVEILPGLLPSAIKEVAKITKHNVIVGGLISDKSDVINALNAGALAISSTNRDVWNL